MIRFRLGVIGFLGVIALGAQTDIADLNRLGNEASDHGDYAKAEPYYRRAVEVYRTMGPDYEAHLAASLLNLAVASCGLGRRTEGASFFEEALAFHRRSLGPKHIRTLTNLNRMATNYVVMGDVLRAERLFDEAIAVERELYPASGELAQSLGGLAAVRVRTGRIDEALPLAEEALETARRAMGEDSPDTAKMYANVAEIHRVAGRPERALPLYRKARFIYQKVLSTNDFRVDCILSQEGLILMAEGKLTLAEQSLQQAVDSMQKSCPACIPELTVVENNLGLLRLRQKRYAEADRLLTHALSLQEKYLAKPGNEMADTLKNLAAVREKERLHEDAVRLQNRAAMIQSYR